VCQKLQLTGRGAAVAPSEAKGLAISPSRPAIRYLLVEGGCRGRYPSHSRLTSGLRPLFLCRTEGYRSHELRTRPPLPVWYPAGFQEVELERPCPRGQLVDCQRR